MKAGINEFQFDQRNNKKLTKRDKNIISSENDVCVMISISILRKKEEWKN